MTNDLIFVAMYLHLHREDGEAPFRRKDDDDDAVTAQLYRVFCHPRALVFAKARCDN